MTKPKLYEDNNAQHPEENLKQGDVALCTASYGWRRRGNEIFNAIGESVAVVAVPISAIKSLRADQVLMVRERTPAKF